MKKVFKYIMDKDYRFLVNCNFGFYKWMDDESYLKRKYKCTFKEELNLDEPRLINEKLQWLKLNDRKDIYTIMVDKYEVKSFVSKIIGKEYVIPTIGVYDSFDDINFNKLPNKFVIKCTHDSGGLVICHNKNKLNVNEARKKVNRCLKKSYFWIGREWPYKNVKPRIIIEELLEDSLNKSKRINDYKVYTFNEKAKFMMINQDRGISTKADYFDLNFNELNFSWGYNHSKFKPAKPKNFEKMFEFAEKLAKGTTEVRVDFYEVNGHIYFGELTFFDGSGFDKVEPYEWNLKLGNMLDINIEGGNK